MLTHVQRVQAHAETERGWFGRLYDTLTGKTRGLSNDLRNALESSSSGTENTPPVPNVTGTIASGGGGSCRSK